MQKLKVFKLLPLIVGSLLIVLPIININLMTAHAFFRRVFPHELTLLVGIFVGILLVVYFFTEFLFLKRIILILSACLASFMYFVSFDIGRFSSIVEFISFLLFLLSMVFFAIIAILSAVNASPNQQTKLLGLFKLIVLSVAAIFLLAFLILETINIVGGASIVAMIIIFFIYILLLSQALFLPLLGNPTVKKVKKSASIFSPHDDDNQKRNANLKRLYDNNQISKEEYETRLTSDAS